MNIKTRKTMRLAIVAAVAVLLISMGRKASAQDEPAGKAPFDSSSLATSTPALGPAVVGVNHALQRNYFSTGNLLAVFFPAFTYEPVDSPQTVTCPGPSGTCTIQADHWIELKGSSMLNDAWACLAVDGVFDPSCGLLEDKVPPDGSWVQISSSHFMSGISAGTHTVQTFVNSQHGVNAAFYNVNYRVFKP